MAVYDKNQKRIRELERAVAAGKKDPASAARRIAELKARGPEYWIKGYDAYGEHYDEQVADAPHSIRAAKAADEGRKAAVRARTYSPTQLLKVKLEKLFLEHLKAMEGRGSYKASRSLCKVAVNVAGALSLEDLDRAPKAVLKRIFERLPETWSDKTRWNFRAFFRASLQDYIDSHHKLVMKNPVDILPMKPGTQERTQYPTWEDHQVILGHLRRNPLRWEKVEGKPPRMVGFPAYLRPLLTVRYEQGLRGMEVIPWRWERADMEYVPGKKFPAIRTRILKSGGEHEEIDVVLTPTSYRALLSLPGQKERGPIWPVRIWPTKLCRRLFDEAGFPHLVAHDYRRAWTMGKLDRDGDRRRAAVGRKTEDSEAFYLHFARKEQEVFYAPEWEQYESSRQSWDQTGDQDA